MYKTGVYLWIVWTPRLVILVFNDLCIYCLWYLIDTRTCIDDIGAMLMCIDGFLTTDIDDICNLLCGHISSMSESCLHNFFTYFQKNTSSMMCKGSSKNLLESQHIELFDNIVSLVSIIENLLFVCAISMCLLATMGILKPSSCLYTLFKFWCCHKMIFFSVFFSLSHGSSGIGWEIFDILKCIHDVSQYGRFTASRSSHNKIYATICIHILLWNW